MGNGDVIAFHTSPTALVLAERPVALHADVPRLDLTEYQRRHFASPQCGYFAVCGKMSSEEEERLMNELVNAMDSQGQNPELWSVPKCMLKCLQVSRHPLFAASA